MLRPFCSILTALSLLTVSTVSHAEFGMGLGYGVSWVKNISDGGVRSAWVPTLVHAELSYRQPRGDIGIFVENNFFIGTPTVEGALQHNWFFGLILRGCKKPGTSLCGTIVADPISWLVMLLTSAAGSSPAGTGAIVSGIGLSLGPRIGGKSGVAFLPEVGFRFFKTPYPWLFETSDPFNSGGIGLFTFDLTLKVLF